MRTIMLTMLIAGGCRKDPDPPPAPPPPPVARDAAPPKSVDAARVGGEPAAADAAVVPDGAPGDADTTYELYDSESIGPLKPGADDKRIASVLGAPTRKSKPIEEGATGGLVSTWEWPSTSIEMYADTAKGPWKARTVAISGTSTLETRRHIHIGSSRKDLERAYPRSPDDDGTRPERYIAGSVYGGLLFTLDHDQVTSIALGAFAF